MRMNPRWFKKIILLILAVSTTSLLPAYAQEGSPAQWVTVNPPAIKGPLPNPGNGAASFHDGYGEHLSKQKYPDTGIEYQRFYWSELEPQEGQYNFALVDEAFTEAARHQPAMNVGLRFMALDGPESGSKIPTWLINKGIKGIWTPDGKTFMPDLDDPIFMGYVQRLLNAFGQRYDGNPELAYLDIGMVGSWGEWHNSNFPGVKPLLERYTSQLLNRYVDMHFAAFPRTPKIMLISGGDSLVYAAKKGAGWRADCWGDWRNFNATWSHMRDDYPSRLEAAKSSWSGFSQAWQKAPVSLEICGYMPEWRSVQHYTREEVQTTLNWALAQHVSTVNLKSREVPQEYRDLVDNALAKMGYRFRVMSLTHEASRRAGQTLTLKSDWSNDGVAPIYLRYNLAWRLQDTKGKTQEQGNTGDDIRQWLPGSHHTEYQMKTPDSLPPGQYSLEVALLDESGKSRIQLANEGRQPDGWYSLSSITVN